MDPRAAALTQLLAAYHPGNSAPQAQPAPGGPAPAHTAALQQLRDAYLTPSDGSGFNRALLTALGDPDTPQNEQFLSAWKQADGGSADNPFNTTQGAPGATVFNSVGVKRYPSVSEGVDATAKTLTNGYYQGILDALASGKDARQAALAVAQSPWGTGSGVLRVLGG